MVFFTRSHRPIGLNRASGAGPYPTLPLSRKLIVAVQRMVPTRTSISPEQGRRASSDAAWCLHQEMKAFDIKLLNLIRGSAAIQTPFWTNHGLISKELVAILNFFF